MIVKLLAEHHFELLSLTGGCIGWSESTLVKMPHCWKSHFKAQLIYFGMLCHTIATILLNNKDNLIRLSVNSLYSTA